MSSRPAAVVLVEGPSDAAVLEVLAARLGLDGAPAVQGHGRALGARHLGGGRLSVVPMGGVTNFGHYLREYGGDPATTVAGLCDGGEARFFARALRRRGHAAETRADLARLGFFVCEDDLEDELIRALGTPAVVEVVAREGELAQLRTFQQQPAQRDRSLHAQLHRFAGVKSGRKVRLAAALAAEVALDRVPAPLRGVLAFAHAEV